jgi:DNA-binding response OmpR family regulator
VKSDTEQKEKRILLVEDDAAYRALVMSTLRKAGIHCTFCVTGDQAMKRLTQETFDLLIMDYLLPGPSAIDILQWARVKGINTPTLIVTNFPSDELRSKTKTLGHTHLMMKEAFSPESIPEVIQVMFGS